jgi:hypothetical protein
VTAAGSAGPASLFLSHTWLPTDYAYDVPPVRGTGEANRTNAGGGVWAFNGRVQAGVDLTLRGSASDRGLPGPVTNPTPTATAVDRSLLLGVRSERAVEIAGSFQWLSSRYYDHSPPVTLPYDSKTDGIGLSGEIGIDRNANLGALAGAWGAHLEGRQDRYSGDGVAGSPNFTSGGLRLDMRLRPRGATALSLAPALRLDMWSGLDQPALSARLDLTWQRRGTSLTVGAGNGVTAPVLADLFFREGNGVRLNPDLRPERIRWELEAGIRQEVMVLGAHSAMALRAYDGRIQDMIIWGLSPAYGYVWTPQNFDAKRSGAEGTITVGPVRHLSASASGALTSVTGDPGGHQILYRPLGTASADLLWEPGAWSFDTRWHFVGSRYPNSAGTNPLPPFGLLDAGAERQVGPCCRLRAAVSDLTDRRAEFIAGFPSPGRTFTLTLTLGKP